MAAAATATSNVRVNTLLTILKRLCTIRSLNPTRILVVEDDRDIADLVGRYLEKAGFAVEIHGSGRDAIRSIAKRPPDLLVLDLMLPQVDGLEICRSVRSND